MLTLGLLQCGFVHPDALHHGGDYPELFAGLFEPLGISVRPYEVYKGEIPNSLSDCQGWITSPSRSSVYDQSPWINSALEIVRELVSDQHRFAGICFGHQLIAQAFDGVVQRSPGGWGVGLKRYEILKQHHWMSPPASSITLVASHEDQVTRLPTGGELFATAPYCPLAGFTLGTNTLAIQPHIEFTPEISATLTELRRDLIGHKLASEALASLSQHCDRTLVAGWIANFLFGDAYSGGSLPDR